MGVVIRQSLKFSAVSYVFMVISILAVIVLYPKDAELIGTLAFFVDTTMLIVPLVLLGFNAVSIKYFPSIHKQFGSGNLLINAGLIIILLGVAGFSLVSWLNIDWLQRKYVDKSSLIDMGAYLWTFIPLLIVVAIHNFLGFHISNYRRIAFPRMVQSLWRITLPLLFLAVYSQVIMIQTGIFLIITHFFLVSIVLLMYLNQLDGVCLDFGQHTLNFIRRPDVITYGGFMLLSSLGASMVYKLDGFMVTTLIDAETNGLYLIPNRIGSLLAVPTAAIIGIASPIISSALKEDNFAAIQNIYRRSSEILTVLGVIMLAGLAVLIQDVFSLMPNSEKLLASGALMIVAFTASTRFFDMATSVNGQIIGYSKMFRYNLYFLVCLAGMNIVLNWILIPIHGIEGAALATFISLGVFNLVKILFIRIKFKMWPWTRNVWFILLIGGLVAFMVYQLDDYLPGSIFIKMGVKSCIVSVVLVTSFYLLKLSDDFNHLVVVVGQRIFKLVRLRNG